MLRSLLAPRLTVTGALTLAGLTVVIAIALAEAYAAISRLVGEAWLGAALVNSALALAVTFYYLRRRETNIFTLGRWQVYIPAAAVLGGAMLLVAMSRALGGEVVASDPGTNLAWVLWVPVVEELVFRLGLGVWFHRFGAPIWAVWFQALTFSIVHTGPTIERLLAGQAGLAVGPLLLALVCQMLLLYSGRIGPAIAFHVACNATVAVFTWGDTRWLEWLGFLYG